MERHIRALFYAISLIIITGCGASRTVPAFKTQAPTSAEQVGFIVRGIEADEVKNIIHGVPESQVRVINTKHKLYEITDVSKEVILSYAPKAVVTSNKFIFATGKPSSKSLAKSRFQELAEARFNSLTNHSPDQQKIIDEIMECTTAPDTSPIPLISSSISNDEAMNGGQVATEIGKTITYSSKQSSSHPDVGGDVTSYWIPALPTGAGAEMGTIVKGDTFSFTPQDLGEHTVFLLVKDRTGACLRGSVAVAATQNVVYKLPALSEIQDFNKIMQTHGGGVDFYTLVNGIEADKYATGKDKVIAVLDSGVNYNHPVLSLKTKLNTADYPNGKDDDGNGFVDDYVGYDFVNSDEFPFDDQGHGSHVSGIAAGMYIGLAQEAMILPVKVINQFGGSDLATILGGIYYAADYGVDVINMSIGIPATSPAELTRAFRYVERKGITIVTSAGNGDPVFGLPMDIDINIQIPASLANTNIISVAASNSKDQLSLYSNFGDINVDIAAPGGDESFDGESDEVIFSATYQNKAELLFVGAMGTSMSTPVVAAAVAMMLEVNPDLTPLEIKEIIKTTSKKSKGLDGLIASGGVLDAGKAVKAAKDKKDTATAIF